MSCSVALTFDTWSTGSVLQGGCVRIGVNDLDAAVRFYVEALGFRLAVRLGDDWAAVDAGGGLIIGLAPRAGDEPPAGVVGLWTSDPLEETVATLADRGVHLDGPIVDKGVVQLAFFRDPDGNRLSLSNAPPSPTSVMRDGDEDHRPLFDHLGLRWTDVGPSGVTVEVDLREDLRGPAGTLQGGVIATLIDAAAASTAAQGSAGLIATSEMTIHFLAPGRRGPVRAIGELLRSRSGGAAVEVRVYDTGQSDRLMAVALAAFDDLKGATRNTREGRFRAE
jgi:uncharacterized protein (TIGR00369 family)